MFFIIICSLGIIAIPVLLDTKRNGRDNILNRSGRELLEDPLIQNIFSSLHIAKKRVNVALVSILSIALVTTIGYVAVRYIGIHLLEFAAKLIFLIFGINK